MKIAQKVLQLQNFDLVHNIFPDGNFQNPLLLCQFKTMNDWNTVKLNFSSLEPQLLSICQTAAKSCNQTSFESIDTPIDNKQLKSN